MKTNFVRNVRKIEGYLQAVPPLIYCALLAAVLLLFATEFLAIVVWSILAVLFLNGLYHIILAFRDFFGFILKLFMRPFAAMYRFVVYK